MFVFQIEEYGSAGECLREQLQEKERQLQKLKQETEELNSMKQQNYLLQSKVCPAVQSYHKKLKTNPRAMFFLLLLSCAMQKRKSRKTDGPTPQTQFNKRSFNKWIKK